MGIFKKKKPSKADMKKAVAKQDKKSRKKGTLADEKAAHGRANTGGSAYCTDCDVWYDLNDWTDYRFHSH